MKKILVTTDFSVNSKAAMRFAVQLASQCDAALTFLHVHYILQPTSWNDSTRAAYGKGETEKVQKELDSFVTSLYKSLKVNPTGYQCVIESSPFVDSTIMTYAADHAFDYLCISARGAGGMEKMFGTTTTNLIGQSAVPVIAVPGEYRTCQVSSVLYASDLGSLGPQLTRVVDFAQPLGASVELLHFSTPAEPVTDPEIIRMAVQQYTDYPVSVHLKPRTTHMNLSADIESVIKVQKPSVVVMFTAQKDGFFELLFTSSHSVDYAYLTTIPLLVFSKV